MLCLITAQSECLRDFSGPYWIHLALRPVLKCLVSSYVTPRMICRVGLTTYLGAYVLVLAALACQPLAIGSNFLLDRIKALLTCDLQLLTSRETRTSS